MDIGKIRWVVYVRKCKSVKKKEVNYEIIENIDD